MTMPPISPIAAVTHADPYPVYADLVAHRPLYFDDALGLWVASSAEAVTAVLTHPLCRVRPPAEPVPNAIAGSPAGDVFGRLVRMNDGPIHAQLKPAIVNALSAIDIHAVLRLGRTRAQQIGLVTASHAERLHQLMFQLPSMVVADLLGASEAQIAQVTGWASAFVTGISPLSGPDQIAQGALATAELQRMLTSHLHERNAPSDNTLLLQLQRETEHIGISDRAIVVANTIGFFSQTYDATAGLIGNTVLALGRQARWLDQLQRTPDALPTFIAEVQRYDAPIQNTRRFVAADTIIMGQQLHAGDAILVLLAAANRDPAANVDPNVLDPDRMNRRSFSVGLGAHACAGEQLALSIAQAAVEQMLTSVAGDDPWFKQLTREVTYHASLNARIAFFASEIQQEEKPA